RRGLVELLRQRDGREPRAMEDLVSVRAADSAEEPRIGQRALERVILADEERAERRGVDRVHLDAAGIERADGVVAADYVNRRALLRARFREMHRARRELERREGETARRLLAAFAPAQPARDHQ